MRLKNRVVVCTGAAGAGIGQTSARRFAEEGAKIVLSDTHEKRVAAAVESIEKDFGVEALGVVCDVRDKGQVENLMKEATDRFGRIDGLLNNAGINDLAHCVDMTDEQWTLVIDVCLRGTFYCVRAVLPTMIEQESGAIVSLASTAGITGVANQAHYAAAKAGIIAFTKSVAMEVGQHSIRVNAIAPGLIMNPFLERIYPEEELQEILRSSLMPRRGKPSDIANAALFLLCDEGIHLTGQTLCLSGGNTMIP